VMIFNRNGQFKTEHVGPGLRNFHLLKQVS